MVSFFNRRRDNLLFVLLFESLWLYQVVISTFENMFILLDLSFYCQLVDSFLKVIDNFLVDYLINFVTITRVSYI